MTQLGSRSGPALRYLWTFSILGDHPQAGPALDRDRNCLDLDRLDRDTWGWSSGELVLIDLAAAIARGWGGCYVGEISTLDDHHRQVALETLRVWLCGDHEAVTV